MLQFAMIESFTHRGLKRLHERGGDSKISANHVARITDVLAHLDRAKTPEALNLPGYRLHGLKGDMKGYWSVRISGNWRIIFRFQDADAYDVDLIDSH